jgi:hypothetical protein
VAVLITVTVSLVVTVTVAFNRAMTALALAVMKIVATVIQHHAKQTAIQQVMQPVQKDRLAIVHVALVTAVPVVIVTVPSVLVAIVQMLARLTVALVMPLLSAKNLSHVMVQVRHAAKVTVTAVVTALMQIAATTVY